MTLWAAGSNIGAEIAAQRTARGLTMYHLATAAKLRREVISDIEAGRQIPRDDEVEGIARVLGISFNQLKFATAVASSHPPKLPPTPSDEEAFERVRIGLDAISTFGKPGRAVRLSRERLGWLVGRTAPLLTRQRDIDIAMIMYDQIVRDTRNSDLNHAKSLEVAATRSRNLLLPVIDGRDGSRLWDSATLNISPTSWQGVFDANSFSAVSRLAGVLGRPLTINVSAIDVAACAAVFIMKFRGASQLP